MLSKAKELYLRLIKGKLVNQIIFVIGIICFIQIITVCLMYLYMYHSREEEIISNNMQILHQANTNYFSGIVDDLSVASKEMFYDKSFTDFLIILAPLRKCRNCLEYQAFPAFCVSEDTPHIMAYRSLIWRSKVVKA